MTLSTHLLLGLPSYPFPCVFPANILYALLFFPILATFPTCFILLYLIFLIMFGEEYKFTRLRPKYCTCTVAGNSDILDEQILSNKFIKDLLMCKEDLFSEHFIYSGLLLNLRSYIA
jgi:hypothetical protein